MAHKQRSRGRGSLFKRNGRGPWVARWFAADGRRLERSTKTTDLRSAERILSKRLADVALRKDGVIDGRLDTINEQASRSIDTHLVDYAAKLRAGGRTEAHITAQISFIEKASCFARWTIATDINADGMNGYANDMKRSNRSAQTIKNHLTAVKGFARWLFTNGKLAYDPLVSVRSPNAAADRRLRRRMLLPDEWAWLRSATLQGPVRKGMSGCERMLLYATAIQTGLRFAELQSLRRGQLHLGDSPAFITCEAGCTKNRKPARQFIHDDLAADLQAHVAVKAPGAAVFGLSRWIRPADLLRSDLDDARSSWLVASQHDPEEYQRRTQSDFLAAVNHSGEKLDFHALRHTCGAWLSMSGAHPKAVQAVMRHSTITLTMDTS